MTAQVDHENFAGALAIEAIERIPVLTSRERNKRARSSLPGKKLQVLRYTRFCQKAERVAVAASVDIPVPPLYGSHIFRWVSEREAKKHFIGDVIGQRA